MKKSLRTTPALLLIGLCLLSLALEAKGPVLETLAITTAEGKSITYNVEIARTESQMRRGLMFRDSMPEDQGMLFIYIPERTATMWMKNTILPLDMLFIDKDGTIINIAENTKPFSLDTISSGGQVRGVLELNAGQVQKYRFAVGDKVSHTTFE
jgi:hypothetical protein